MDPSLYTFVAFCRTVFGWLSIRGGNHRGHWKREQPDHVFAFRIKFRCLGKSESLCPPNPVRDPDDTKSAQSLKLTLFLPEPSLHLHCVTQILRVIDRAVRLGALDVSVHESSGLFSRQKRPVTEQSFQNSCPCQPKEDAILVDISERSITFSVSSLE